MFIQKIKLKNALCQKRTFNLILKLRLLVKLKVFLCTNLIVKSYLIMILNIWLQ
jgi:hypothetical protein